MPCNGAQNPRMVPTSQQRPMFYSTNQKSSVAIFIGKPILHKGRGSAFRSTGASTQNNLGNALWTIEERGRPFEFRVGERIHTENSYKYAVSCFRAAKLRNRLR